MRARRAIRTAHAEEGSAIVEFLGAALLLLVPVVYLVLVLGRLQAAAFAVDGAAREAARAMVTAADAAQAEARAVAAIGLALEDQGLPADADAATLTVVCEATCLTPGSSLTATVQVDVVLPGVPSWLDQAVPMRVPVSASATASVDDYVARG